MEDTDKNVMGALGWIAGQRKFNGDEPWARIEIVTVAVNTLSGTELKNDDVLQSLRRLYHSRLIRFRKNDLVNEFSITIE